MKYLRTTFSLAFSIIFTSVFSQSTIITDWGYSYGNHCGYNSTALDVKTDLNGNHISTGTIYRTAMSTSTDLDPSPTASFPAGTTYTNDFYIAKYNPNGSFISAFIIGGPGADGCTSLAIDKNNNIIATGYFTGTVDFDPSASTATAASTGTLNAFLAKYSNTGNLIWIKTFPCSANGRGVKVITDNQDNIYLTAYFSGTMDIDPASTTVNLVSNGSNDVCLAKFDALGNLISGNSFGGGGADVSVDIVLDQNKRLFITGTFNNTVDFDPSLPGSYTLANVSGSADVFVSKFDSLLNFQWAKSIVNSNVVLANDIEIDNTGNVLLTGYFYFTSVDLDMSLTTVTSFSTAQSSVFLAKYDNNGNYLWAGTFGNASMLTGNIGSCVWTDNSGNIYNAGTFGGTIDVDFSASTYTLANGSSGPALYIAKYTAAGTIVSASKLSSGYIYVFSGHRNANGDMLFCGNMNNPITLFPNTSLPMPNQCGNYFDSYIAKFKECNVPVISGISTSTNNVCPTTGTVMLSITGGTLNGATSWQWSAGSCLGTAIGSGTSVVVTPITSMLYYVKGIGGCAGNSLSCTSVSVSTLPAPSLSVSGSNTVCPNTGFTLTANGASTYTWSNGSNSPSVALSTSAATVYSVSTTGTNGCVFIVPKQVKVYSVVSLTRTAMLDFATTSTDRLDTVNCGKNLLIRHEGATSYTGSCNCFTTNTGLAYYFNFLNIQATSVYTVNYTDGNNFCKSSAIYTIDIWPCVNLEEQLLLTGTNIYPNPVSTVVTLKSHSNAMQQVVIYNVLGKVLHQFNYQNSIDVDMSNYPPGVYTFSIYSKGQIIETKKVIRQ